MVCFFFLFFSFLLFFLLVVGGVSLLSPGGSLCVLCVWVGDFVFFCVWLFLGVFCFFGFFFFFLFFFVLVGFGGVSQVDYGGLLSPR